MGEQTAQLFTLSSETLSTVKDTIVGNVGVILPLALGLFAIVASINFIPKLLKKFSK